MVLETIERWLEMKINSEQALGQCNATDQARLFAVACIRLVRRPTFFVISVAMPMVQIGPVFVLMLSRVVFVPVHMAHRDRKTVVLVVVMAVSVPMAMLMRHRIVPVDVCMPLAKKQHQRSRNDPSRQCLSSGEGLPENGHRQQQPEERT